MGKKRLLVGTACAAAFVGVGASAAFAGEITGNGKPTPINQYRAASICSFSGQNDGNPPAGRTAAHVQNWGQLTQEARAANAAIGRHPGDACNGHTGLLAGP